MSELIFATNNLHKLNEIRQILLPEYRIHGLRESGIEEEIPEDFPTLEENAEQKAGYIYNLTGQDCFADDTGLEVDALNGAPGVWSARYSRTGSPVYPEMEITAGNIRKLLEQLSDKKNRTAQFRTVICLIINGKVNFFEGIIKGHILEKPVGNDGFGYDPVFQPEGFDQSFAAMPFKEKNRISHRAIAVGKLVNYLKQSDLGREK